MYGAYNIEKFFKYSQCFLSFHCFQSIVLTKGQKNVTVINRLIFRVGFFFSYDFFLYDSTCQRMWHERVCLW